MAECLRFPFPSCSTQPLLPVRFYNPFRIYFHSTSMLLHSLSSACAIQLRVCVLPLLPHVVFPCNDAGKTEIIKLRMECDSLKAQNARYHTCIRRSTHHHALTCLLSLVDGLVDLRREGSFVCECLLRAHACEGKYAWLCSRAAMLLDANPCMGLHW